MICSQNNFFFHTQRWTSRVWSSHRSRLTAWTASATERRITTASRAARVTPATQPHIPTDCSHTTVKTPRPSISLPPLHPEYLQSPAPPTTYIRPVDNGGTPWICSFFPGPCSLGSTWGCFATQASLTPPRDHWPYWISCLKQAPPDIPCPPNPLCRFATGSERVEQNLWFQWGPCSVVISFDLLIGNLLRARVRKIDQVRESKWK